MPSAPRASKNASWGLTATAYGATASTMPRQKRATAWAGASPRSSTGNRSTRGPLDHLVLHHTAFATSGIHGRSFEAEAAHMREIQRWHFERGWATVGYHFVVSPTGRIFRGRPVDRLGAHVLGHNVGT